MNHINKLARLSEFDFFGHKEIGRSQLEDGRELVAIGPKKEERNDRDDDRDRHAVRIEKYVKAQYVEDHRSEQRQAEGDKATGEQA
jgi:hypothetical protein